MRPEILEALREALLDHGPLTVHGTAVWDRVCVANTWGSNAIEGNDLTRSEVETLVINRTSVGGHPVARVLEAVQHARAFDGLFRRLDDPVTVVTSRELHDEVFRGVMEGAGRWREADIHIKGSRFDPPHADEVEDGMAAWEDEHRGRCRDGEPALEVGAWMHHRFEAIHPFDGGNGRVGRLLLDLHLLKRGWPPVSLGPGDRKRYFDALEMGSEGDLSPLENLLSEAMGRSLLGLLDRVGENEDRLRSMEDLENRGSGFLAFLVHKAEVGEMPAVRVGESWRSSERALGLFIEGGTGD